jgi:hypothetical protein
MAGATVRLDGGGSQTLEVMSEDIGADLDGLDRTIAGHFPIGTVRVGPAATTVDLVDAHDNANDGQGSCEAVYTSDLVIGAGSTLNTNTCRVYYETLTLDGSVDTPGNLIPFEQPCDGDADGGGMVDVNDLSYVLFRLGNTGTPGEVDGDANGDGVVDVNDISYVVFRLGNVCP